MNLIPPFAYPVIAAFLIACVVALLPTGPLLGLSHHTYTGILFGTTVLASAIILIVGLRKESLNDKAGNK